MSLTPVRIRAWITSLYQALRAERVRNGITFADGTVDG
jgi:hypothetical protein